MTKETAEQRRAREYRESEIKRVERETTEAVTQAHQGQTSEDRYESGINSLCQKLDRILSGESELTVMTGESGLSPAMTTWRGKRSRVSLDHKWIMKWVKRDKWAAMDLQDRIQLTLALNLHELGHVLFSPRTPRGGSHSDEDYQLMNALEDQRQEMLVTREYPKAADYFRICNIRALREALLSFSKAGQPIPHQLFLLYYGRRHLFPKDVNVLLIRAFLDATDMHSLSMNKYTETDLQFVKDRIKEFMGLAMTSAIDTARAWSIVDQLHRFWERSQGLNPFTENCLPEGGEAVRSTEERSQAVQGATQARQKQEPKENAETQEAKQRTGAKDSKESKESPKEEAESEADGEGQDADAEGQDADEGEEGDGEGDGEGEGEAEGEGEGEGDTDGTGEGDSDGESDTHGESTEEESESGGPGQGGGKGTRKIDLDNPQGPSEQGPSDPVMDAIQELADSEAESEEKVSTEVQDYGKSVFTSDKINLPASLQVTAQNLARLLEDISTDLKEQNFRNQPSGRFDLHGLAGKLSSGSDKLFYRKQNDMSREAAMGIHIAVDISGSMRNKVDRAMLAAYTIAKAGELSGHMTRISSFSQAVEQVKGWHSTRVNLPEAGGDTRPLPIFQAALKDFRKLEDTEGIHNHTLIVITDGQWGDALGCQKEMTKLRKAGVYIILIGIEYRPQDGVKPYEDTYAQLVVTDVTDLTRVMRETLKKLSIQVSHDALRKSW